MANENNQGGIVYVLTNPEMPGLVKIGKTSRDEVEERLKELYSTGVPVPFECEYAARVEDSAKTEKAFHTAFGPYRINPNREFFRIDPEQAIEVLTLLANEDVTPNVQKEAGGVETDANARATIAKRVRRRPGPDFGKMGIPKGSELKFRDSDATVKVVDNSRVCYEGENYSLTRITKKLSGAVSVRRLTPYWTYNGRPLNEIYDETYGPRDW